MINLDFLLMNNAAIGIENQNARKNNQAAKP